jgi:hypothetical protein
MWSSTPKKLPDEPIVVVTVQQEDNDITDEEVAQSIKDRIAFLDSLDEPVFYISDFSSIKIDLAGTILGSNLAARGENPIFHHQNIREIIYVTQSVLSKLAARGMDSEAFGSLKINVFGTVEEALAYARASL